MIPPARPLAVVQNLDGTIWLRPTQTPPRIGTIPHVRGEALLPGGSTAQQNLVWVFPELAQSVNNLTPTSLRNLARRSFDYAFGAAYHRSLLNYMPQDSDLPQGAEKNIDQMFDSLFGREWLIKEEYDDEARPVEIVAELENVIDPFGADTAGHILAYKFAYRREFDLGRALGVTQNISAYEMLRYESWETFIAQENRWIVPRTREVTRFYQQHYRDIIDVWHGRTPIWSERKAMKQAEIARLEAEAQQQAKRESDARIRAEKAREHEASARAREIDARRANDNRLTKSQEERNYAAAKWSRSHSRSWWKP